MPKISLSKQVQIHIGCYRKYVKVVFLSTNSEGKNIERCINIPYWISHYCTWLWNVRGCDHPEELTWPTIIVLSVVSLLVKPYFVNTCARSIEGNKVTHIVRRKWDVLMQLHSFFHPLDLDLSVISLIQNIHSRPVEFLISKVYSVLDLIVNPP